VPNDEPRESLARLRTEIESIDREIVLLIAARLEAADRALQLRVVRGRPITDPDQERRVLGRARAWAEAEEVPSTLVERLFRALVEEGKSRFLTGRPPRSNSSVTVLVPEPRGAAVRLEDRPRTDLRPVPPAR